MENEVKLPTPPDGYEYVIQKKPKIKQEEIQELENELKKLKKPTNEELLELGKMTHPYYFLLYNINMLNDIK